MEVTRTPEQLAAMAPHVHYEVAHLAWFAKEGNAWVREHDPPVPFALMVEAGLLEAALMHLRAVIEFLQAHEHESRISAVQYLPEWKLRRGEKVPQPKVRELHNRVAHVGMARGSVAEEGPFVWREFFEQWVPHVLTTFRRFLDEVPEPYRSTITQTHAEGHDLDALLPASVAPE